MTETTVMVAAFFSGLQKMCLFTNGHSYNNPCELAFAQVDTLGCSRLLQTHYWCFLRVFSYDEGYFDSFEEIIIIVVFSIATTHV